LAEPFHPDSKGTRIPEITARDTLTYSGFGTHTFTATNSASGFILFSWFNALGSTEMFGVYGASFDSLKAATPVAITGVYNADSYKVSVLGSLAAANLASGSQGFSTTDSTPEDTFSKYRVAAGGLRLFKTSVNSNNEAGNVDIVYSRDGTSLDTGNANILNDISRPRSDRIRLYLAGDQQVTLRGQTGFVG
jgi:hypothetical protein